MNVYGIIAIQEYDSQGERFNIAGVDVTHLDGAPLTKTVKAQTSDEILGVITDVKKILSHDDVKNTFDSTLWEGARHTPIVVVKAVITDDKLKDVLRAGGRVYFAACGKLMERKIDSNEFDKDYRVTLTKCVLDAAFVTLRPVHRLYRMIPVEALLPAAKPASRHPMQDIAYDVHGIIRFRANKIVKRLAEYAHGAGWDRNAIMREYQQGLFTQEDFEQFEQITGWSVSGYSDINGVSPESKRAASAIARALHLAKEKTE